MHWCTQCCHNYRTHTVRLFVFNFLSLAIHKQKINLTKRKDNKQRHIYTINKIIIIRIIIRTITKRNKHHNTKKTEKESMSHSMISLLTYQILL